MWNRSLARILTLDIFPSSIQFLDKPSRTRLREYTCTFFHLSVMFCAPTPTRFIWQWGKKSARRVFRRQCDWHSIVARSDADSSIFIAHCSKSNKRPPPPPPGKNPACRSPRAHPYFAHCLLNQCAIFAGGALPVNIKMRDRYANHSRHGLPLINLPQWQELQSTLSNYEKLNRFTGSGVSVAASEIQEHNY